MMPLSLLIFLLLCCTARQAAGQSYCTRSWGGCAASSTSCTSSSQCPGELCADCFGGTQCSYSGAFCGSCQTNDDCVLARRKGYNSMGDICTDSGSCSSSSSPTPAPIKNQASGGGAIGGAIVLGLMAMGAMFYYQKDWEIRKRGAVAIISLCGTVCFGVSGSSHAGALAGIWFAGGIVFAFIYDANGWQYRNYGLVITSIVSIGILAGVALGSKGTSSSSPKANANFTIPAAPTPLPTVAAGLPTPLPTSRPTVSCPAGYFSNSTDYTACSPCPPGSWSTGGWSSKTCYYCNPGTASNVKAQANACPLCPVGTYTPGVGAIAVPVPLDFPPPPSSVLSCRVCPGGIVTPLPGSVDVSQCIDPMPNFVVGAVGLILALLLVSVYFCYGRFFTIARSRHDRIIHRQMIDCDWIDSQLGNFNKKHGKERPFGKYQELVSGGGRLAKQGDSAKIAFQFAKAFLVMGIGGFLAIFSTVFFFLGLLSGIFFKALIIWKHLRLVKSFKIQIPYPVVVALSISEIMSDLRAMAFPFVQLIDPILTLFAQLFQFFSSINIDFNVVVSITCKGSTAPLELLMDMVVLGVIILVIESKVQLFREITFKHVTHKFFATMTSDEFFKKNTAIQDYLCHILLLIQCMVAEFCSSCLNFQSLLQFSMSFVNLQSFIADNGKHESTLTCDQVKAAPNMDSFLAWSSTIAALISIPPALFEISKILCPHHPTDSHDGTIEIAAKLSMKSSKVKCCSFLIRPIRWFLTLISPDMILFRFASSWIDTMRIAINGQTSIYKNKMQRILILMGKVGISTREIEKTREEFERALAPQFDVMAREKPASLEAFHKLFQDLKSKYPNELHNAPPIHESVFSLEAWGWTISSVASNDDEPDEPECYRNPNPKTRKELAGKALLLRLPTYYGLLQAESCELFGMNGAKWAPLMALIVIGHVFTKVGRKAFTLVLLRYYTFLCVCIGYWSDTRKACFGLFESSKDGKIFHPSEDAKQFHLLSSSSRRALLGQNSSVKTLSKEKCDNMSEYIRAVIAPRAILLQIVPHLTILSVFSAATAGSPLLVTDPELASHLHPLLSTRSSNKTNKLVKTLEMILALVNESRISNFILQAYTVAVSVYILYFPIGRMVLLSVALLVPFCVFKGLGVVVSLVNFIAKVFNVEIGDLFCMESMPLNSDPRVEVLAHAIQTILESLKELNSSAEGKPSSDDDHNFSKMNIHELRAWKIRLKELAASRRASFDSGRNSFSEVMQNFDSGKTSKLYDAIDVLIKIQHEENAAVASENDDQSFSEEIIEMHDLFPGGTRSSRRSPSTRITSSRSTRHNTHAMWLYVDNKGTEQGPFDKDHMCDWTEYGYFTSLTMIRLTSWRSFHRLRDVFPSIDDYRLGEQPFLNVPDLEPESLQGHGHSQRESYQQHQRESFSQQESPHHRHSQGHSQQGHGHGHGHSQRESHGHSQRESHGHSHSQRESYQQHQRESFSQQESPHHRHSQGHSQQGHGHGHGHSQRESYQQHQHESDFGQYSSSRQIDGENPMHGRDRGSLGIGGSSRRLNPGTSSAPLPPTGFVSAASNLVEADDNSIPQSRRISIRDSIGPSLAGDFQDFYSDAQSLAHQELSASRVRRESDQHLEERVSQSAQPVSSGNRFGPDTTARPFARPPGALSRAPSVHRGNGAGAHGHHLHQHEHQRQHQHPHQLQHPHQHPHQHQRDHQRQSQHRQHESGHYPDGPRGSWSDRMSTGSMADAFMRSSPRDSRSSSRRAQL